MLIVIEAFTHTEAHNQLAISLSVNTIDFMIYNFKPSNKKHIEEMGFRWNEQVEFYVKQIKFDNHHNAERILQINIEMIKFSLVEFTLAETNLSQLTENSRFRIEF